VKGWERGVRRLGWRLEKGLEESFLSLLELCRRAGRAEEGVLLELDMGKY